uniref:Uncharacterized protein n=1 Tax=Rhizophora mucronata TaxID=61149 RepID=A0A2P2NSH1_RHIMU
MSRGGAAEKDCCYASWGLNVDSGPLPLVGVYTILLFCIVLP